MILNSLQLSDALKANNAEAVQSITDLTFALSTHKIYSSIRSIEDIRTYMEYQVWCVWDFMALLKSIQSHYLSSSISWIPPVDAQMGHFIYAMLISEETDDDNTGLGHSSHFETYLRGMSQAGANRKEIDCFITALRSGLTIDDALALAKPPACSLDFVKTTIKLARGPIHAAVAAFCLSREGIIPDMFTTFLNGLKNLDKQRLGIFEWYLKRHVSVDTDSHGPLSALALTRVIDNDQKIFAECLAGAREALEARAVFLDKIYESLPSQNT